FVEGATFTWDGGSTVNNNWSTQANWLNLQTDNTVPPPGSDIVFGTSTDAAVLDSANTVGSMTFNLGSSYTLGVSNSSSISISTGITTAGSSGLKYTVSPSLILTSDNVFDVGANNTLTLSAAVTSGANTLGF